jgi:predicted transcriptional regulator
MDKNNQLLISLEERHANNILSGMKSVELRRRQMHVEPGAIVWLYVKTPIAAVVGYAEVGQCDYAAPSTIWRNLGSMTGLERKEFNSYFSGLSRAFALGLKNPYTLASPISLYDLRKKVATFQPPQFYLKVPTDSSLELALSSSLSPAHKQKKRQSKKPDDAAQNA